MQLRNIYFIVLAQKGSTLLNKSVCMAKTFKDYGVFFTLLGVFIVAGGIYLGMSSKVDAILFFSENRTPALNTAFNFITKLGEEPMYFVLALAALTYRIRYTLMIAITGLVVMGLSFSLKSFFAIDRPKAFFAKQNLLDELNLIDGIDLYTGATSFPSGHAMSAFALYTLLIFILPPKKRYILPLFSLALLVGISRVYLVQHFWPDVYVGGILGSFLAMAIYTLHTRLEPKPTSWLDKPIFKIGKFSA